MTDARLRALEREAAASGMLEAQVALLHARVRLGDLDVGWLEAAARLGHEAARRALGRFVPVVWSDGLRDLVRDLGAEGIVRALVAWAQELGPEPDDREALGALEAWLERRDASARSRCQELARGRDEVALLGYGVVNARALAEHAAAQACGHAGPDDLPEVWGSPPLGPTEAQARAIRRALAEWALARPRGCAAPAWPEPAVDAAALQSAAREARERFEAALAAKATRREATALRRRLREKTLTREMVEVAADLAHPAAWLVCRREGLPDLVPPATGRELAARLEAIVGARAAPTRRKVLERRYWVGEDGAERSAVGRRTELGDARWPEWGARFVVRAALELAERALPAAEAARPDDPRPREALEAVRAWYACPCAAHARQAGAAATRAGQAARRLADGPEAGAAGVLAAAAGLVARTERAWNPGLGRGRHVLLDEAVRAGEAPDALWEHLRRVLIAWALGADLLGARRYAPTERYAVGEVLEHPTFGRGRVTAVEPARVHVTFEDAVRVLVHGRG